MKNMFWLLAGMLVCGCSSVAPRVIVEPVESQVVEVQSGECIVVLLEENGTTGYSWEARYAVPEVEVEIVHLPPTLSRTTGGKICGAPGMAKVVLRVGAEIHGEGVVKLVYRRPWSDEVAREVELKLKR